MAQRVNKSIIVKGDVERLYALCVDVENFPKFMDPVTLVEKTGERTSHWVVEGPSDETIEWNVETTTLERNTRIAWNSTGGDVQTTGQITLTPLPNEQTHINVILQYAPQERVPAGTAAKLRQDPEKQLLECLRSFKRYAEEEWR